MSARVKLESSKRGGCENDSEDEFYDVERSNPVQDDESSDGTCMSACPWKEELEVLVRGGAPMALRGEVIQPFALCILVMLFSFLVNNHLIFSSGKHLRGLRNAGWRIITKIC